MLAALAGSRETVTTLLEIGADPNLLSAGGRSPLSCALSSQDAVCTSLLADDTNTGNILIILTLTLYHLYRTGCVSSDACKVFSRYSLPG